MAKERSDRENIARIRLSSVINRHGAAIARTIEQKISDAGPFDQRIDPHILNPVRNQMVKEGQLIRHRAHGVDWYSTMDVPTDTFQSRIEEQFAVYQLILHGDFNARMGEVLEIAVYRALQESPLLSLGGFRKLTTEPTSQKLKKEEPPSIFSGRELSGNKRFDFLVGQDRYWAGIEVKNIREWLYPDREEIRDLLAKAVDLNIPPILIARRIPYVTRRLLSVAGVLMWETRHQYYPPEYDNLAGQVRAKTSLGYFDVTVSDRPDKYLREFIVRIVPEELPQATERFLAHRDILGPYGRGDMSYREFAARLRRRENGTDEDFDPEEDAIDIPF